MRAAKRLLTSKGEVAAGGLIPDDLEGGELDRLKLFGGVSTAAVQAVEASDEGQGDPDPVEIPEGWRDLSWPKLRSLAGQVSSAKAGNKAEAVAAIEAEVERRAGAEGGTDDGQARADAIAEIMEMLDNSEFTQDGKPEVDAINAAMPEGAEPVTADERDTVWASMEPAE